MHVSLAGGVEHAGKYKLILIKLPFAGGAVAGVTVIGGITVGAAVNLHQTVTLAWIHHRLNPLSRHQQSFTQGTGAFFHPRPSSRLSGAVFGRRGDLPGRSSPGEAAVHKKEQNNNYR